MHTLDRAILTLQVLIYLHICLPLVDVSFHMVGTMPVFICVSSLSSTVMEHTGPTALDYKFRESGVLFSCVAAVFLRVLHSAWHVTGIQHVFMEQMHDW